MVSKRIKLDSASVMWRGELGDEDRRLLEGRYTHLSDAAWDELQSVVRLYASELNLYQGATIKEVAARLDKVHRAIRALQEAIDEADTPAMGFASSHGLVRYFQDHNSDPAPDFDQVFNVVNSVLEQNVEGDTAPIAHQVTDAIWAWITDGRQPGQDIQTALWQYDEAIVHSRLNPGVAKDPHASFLLNLTDWAGKHHLPVGASKKDEPLPFVRLAVTIRELIPRELRPGPKTTGSIGKEILELRKARRTHGGL